MKDDKTGLIYKPAPRLPEDFEYRLKQIAGVCPTGEPGIRFVWGCDRMDFYAGREDQKYIDPNGVYVGLPYFVAEAWSPETVYDRDEWERSRYGMLIPDLNFGRCSEAMPIPCQDPGHYLAGRVGLHQVWDSSIDVLGPYPERGVWDLVAFCHGQDLSPLTPEKMLNLAREWKHNRERPQAVKRMVDDYMRYKDGVQARRTAAWLERKGEEQEFLAEELAKPDTNPVNSFDTIGPAPRSKNVAPGMRQTAAGIIVPSSALDN